MKTIINLHAKKVILCLFSLLLISQGCKKDVQNSSNPSSAATINAALKSFSGLTAVNLVSDTVEYTPAHLDANLVNAWGLAFGPTGGIWVSSNEKSLSGIYDKDGNTLRPPVAISLHGDLTGSSPTGQVFNPTTGFAIPSNGKVSKFIFATENGTIAAWASGDTATTVADRSAQGAVYKGIEMASSGGSWFLYATDFHNGKIDVFDQNFNYVSKSFSDPSVPAGFAPFNIRLLAGKLFVTYAKQLAPDNHDDQAGPGNGFVDIYKTDGSFVKRFATGGTLNSPWGLEISGEGSDMNEDQQRHGENEDNDELDDVKILVGNFGDGHINIFNSNGKSKGQLMGSGSPVVIEGLWAISYPPKADAYKSVSNRLYFTAGPDDESHGIFGYIQ